MPLKSSRSNADDRLLAAMREIGDSLKAISQLMRDQAATATGEWINTHMDRFSENSRTRARLTKALNVLLRHQVADKKLSAVESRAIGQVARKMALDATFGARDRDRVDDAIYQCILAISTRSIKWDGFSAKTSEAMRRLFSTK